MDGAVARAMLDDGRRVEGSGRGIILKDEQHGQSLPRLPLLPFVVCVLEREQRSTDVSSIK